MGARAIDVHALPARLTALRPPSFHRHWQALAERADQEGWPAARFLAALAEIELAERDTRRIRRHLLEANLPAGKTLATVDFKALPGIPRARIEALAAGDWLETGAKLTAIGDSGAGKTHLLSAIAHALVEAGRRVLYTRTTDLVQRPQAARRDLALEQALARLDRFDLVILDDIAYCPEGPIRNQRHLRADRPPLRRPQPRDRRQPALQRLGAALPRQGHGRRSHRPPRPPRHHPRDERRQLSPPHRGRAPDQRQQRADNLHRQPRCRPAQG
jgi:DNA replication protein DnaC